MALTPTIKPPQIDIYEAGRCVRSVALSLPFELGRSSDLDAGHVYAQQTRVGYYRIAIAGKEFNDMSRQLMLIEPVGEAQVRVRNMSDKTSNTIHVRAQQPLGPKQQRELVLPISLEVFDRRIDIWAAKPPEPPEDEHPDMVLSMNEPVPPPGSEIDEPSVDVSSNFPLAEKLSTQDKLQLVEWLKGVARVLQSAIGSAEFCERAAEEMVKLIGLDSGRVLDIKNDGTWAVIASYERETGKGLSSGWVPVSGLLRQVKSEKKTCWTIPGKSQATTASMQGLSAAIAAPLLDRDGNVTGALYGDRRGAFSLSGELIGPLEAMLVETLARVIAAGQLRIEQEQAAAAVRVRFEQFFTPELSRQLAANPGLLTPRDTEVSILFCDIRRFSTISEACGPEITMEWLRDVMGTLADIAANLGGALIDYAGDELMLMWGAPAPQADHAARACEAALKMAREVPKLDLKWRDKIGHATQFGFGVNTGRARVGNVGFKRKFRYAPFGNTVNLASRVQGATKYFGVTVIVTEEAFAQLRTPLVSRRLCRVRVVNIDHPVALYELHVDDAALDEDLCQQYETALRCYEQGKMPGKLPQAVHAFSQILQTRPNDGPTRLLLPRAVSALSLREDEFDPVLELMGK
jgi:adenylate cyclase